MNKSILKSLLRWILPAAIYDFISGFWISAYSFFYFKGGRNLFKNNSVFKNKHKNERCFILCNGPSVNGQNLIPLKEEIVFSVSGGFQHEDYLEIKPNYHCVPAISYDVLAKDNLIHWFKEMDKYLGDAELFANYTEKSFFKEENLFTDKKVNYICSGRSFESYKLTEVDLTKVLPAVQSVPIMALLIAIYMGFSEIYLLGTDHDCLSSGEYKYSYEGINIVESGNVVNKQGVIESDFYPQVVATKILWENYMYIKRIADFNNIKIYNATNGGMLDVFERVKYEEVVGSAK